MGPVVAVSLATRFQSMFETVDPDAELIWIANLAFPNYFTLPTQFL